MFVHHLCLVRKFYIPFYDATPHRNYGSGYLHFINSSAINGGRHYPYGGAGPVLVDEHQPAKMKVTLKEVS